MPNSQPADADSFECAAHKWYQIVRRLGSSLKQRTRFWSKRQRETNTPKTIPLTIPSQFRGWRGCLFVCVFFFCASHIGIRSRHGWLSRGGDRGVWDIGGGRFLKRDRRFRPLGFLWSFCTPWVTWKQSMWRFFWCRESALELVCGCDVSRRGRLGQNSEENRANNFQPDRPF